MQTRRTLERNFKFHAEPEGGINSPEDFNRELCDWACREHHDLEILTDSMEPEVKVDGVRYSCQLGDPNTSPVTGFLEKAVGLPMYNHGAGRFHGYQWIYFYEAE